MSYQKNKLGEGLDYTGGVYFRYGGQAGPL